MISPLSQKIHWSDIIPYLIVLAPFIFFLIGIPFGQIVSDASTYDLYARHIVIDHNYSLDGNTFSALREPGYPLFLAIIFYIFGVGNYTAVYIIQTLLLGFLGLMVYKIFARLEQKRVAYIAGFLITLLPSYGLYTHTTGTELLFAFLVGVIFYQIVQITIDYSSTNYKHYTLLGSVCGIATLVRVQLVFFLPLLILLYLIWRRKEIWKSVANSIITSLVFAVIVGSWVGYVHKNTGTFALTSGRIELALYTRAVRTKLSYKQLTDYAILWIERSLKGGAEESGFLYENEYHKIGNDYWSMATTTSAVAAIKKQSIGIILTNPGRYAYGNIIEIIKTLYIEHDYSDVLNRYIRAGMYIIVYGLCLFGFIVLWRLRKKSGDKDLKSLALISILFIAYNLIILSPFDSIPRYNTPYLTFYVIIGSVGLALVARKFRLKKIDSIRKKQ